MVNRNFIVLAVIIVAAFSVGILNPGAFFSQGQIKSFSGPTASPSSGQQAYLVDLYPTGGSQGLSGQGQTEAVYDVLSSHGVTNTQNDYALAVSKINDSYVYTLTERVSSNKYIYKYQLYKECVGNNFLTDSNACNWGGAPWNNLAGATLYDKFNNWCSSLGVSYTAYSTGIIGNEHLRCYQQVPRWVIGDFNQVGGYYTPNIRVDAFTYTKGTKPWQDNSQFTLIASLIVSPSSTGGVVKTASGVSVAEVQMTNLVSTFSTPPPQTDVRAVSSVQSPRAWVLAGNVDSTYALGTGLNSIQGRFADSLSKAKQSLQNYDEAKFTAAINQYNFDVDNVVTLTPLTGQWAPNAQAIDTSKLNSQNTISIVNNFAIPEVLMWTYLSNLQIFSTQATPTSVSCQGGTIPSGTSYAVPISIGLLGTPSGQAVSYSLSCSSPLSGVSSGSVYPTSNPWNFNSQPIQSGQAGTSTCTVSATGNSVTVSNTCQFSVSPACNNQIPSGCVLNLTRATPSNPCPVDCPPPPTICTDGTQIGNCNFLHTQRCLLVNGVPTLQVDSSCNTPNQFCADGTQIGNCNTAKTMRCVLVSNLPALQNDTSCSIPPSMCIPFVQKLSTTVVGGINLFGWQIGGVPVQTCVWDFTTLGIALLIGAFLLLRMRRVKEAQAVGLAGIVLILLSVIVDNATLIALGGAGLALIAGVIIAAYVVIKFVVRI